MKAELLTGLAIANFLVLGWMCFRRGLLRPARFFAGAAIGAAVYLAVVH